MSTEARTEFELGTFRFAKVLAFPVLGDDPHDPGTVRVVLDDGIQEPYPILTIEAVGRFEPPPVPIWRENWIAPNDPWARIIYGNTLGVIRQARARGSRI